ncbi:MAG: HU family DNA-binding protein [Deltaproteobacteria bacterium]|nr:HU family DNA-binding protein [Deltaproteobacteria bacterium]MBW2307690.1 HU family DNA-binding protein [Deltaproteobacteria bacterium]
MTKAELVAKMAGTSGISKAAAEKALKGFTDGITMALKKGEKVTLVGFGTFSVSKRAERKGRNPRDGKVIKIPASKVAKFKPGKAMKESVK